MQKKPNIGLSIGKKGKNGGEAAVKKYYCATEIKIPFKIFS